MKKTYNNSEAIKEGIASLRLNGPLEINGM